jgi:hypothetical protein
MKSAIIAFGLLMFNQAGYGITMPSCKQVPRQVTIITLDWLTGTTTGISKDDWKVECNPNGEQLYETDRSEFTSLQDDCTKANWYAGYGWRPIPGAFVPYVTLHEALQLLGERHNELTVDYDCGPPENYPILYCVQTEGDFPNGNGSQTTIEYSFIEVAPGIYVQDNDTRRVEISTIQTCRSCVAPASL